MTATQPAALFPAELSPRRKQLELSANHPEDPREWPEGERVIRAYGPAEIGELLAEMFHPLIGHRKIAYLFVESIVSHGAPKLGTAARASSKLAFLAKVDFVITLNLPLWWQLTFEQRIALVDHELSHLCVDSDDGRLSIVPHDVEEFGTIVRRWGLWQPRLRRFAEVVAETAQGDLFSPPKDEKLPDPERCTASKTGKHEPAEKQNGKTPLISGHCTHCSAEITRTKVMEHGRPQAEWGPWTVVQ